MKLSDFKDEAALDLLADIIEPATEIMADADMKKLFFEDRVKCAAYVLRTHKRAIMTILAAMDGKSNDEFHCSIFTAPGRVLEILNDPEMKEFFMSQGLRAGAKPSGSATASSEAGQ